jgi:hypothetical protein
MSRYARDPFWMTAKFDSKAADGTPIKNGDRIFYFPLTKRAFVGEAAERAAARFEAERADENLYGGGG